MITKTIEIDGIEVKFAACAETPLIYWETFQSDMLNDLALMSPNSKDVSLVVLSTQLAYAMAKQADDNIKSYREWLRDFANPIAFVNNLEKIIAIWNDNAATLVEVKKKVDKPSGG